MNEGRTDSIAIPVASSDDVAHESSAGQGEAVGFEGFTTKSELRG